MSSARLQSAQTKESKALKALEAATAALEKAQLSLQDCTKAHSEARAAHEAARLEAAKVLQEVGASAAPPLVPPGGDPSGALAAALGPLQALFGCLAQEQLSQEARQH